MIKEILTILKVTLQNYLKLTKVREIILLKLLSEEDITTCIAACRGN